MENVSLDPYNYPQDIQARQDTLDEKCFFKVIRNADNTYSFLAENNKYLGPVYHAAYNVQGIEADKTTIDYSSRLTVTDYPDGTISLRATNGKYLGYVSYGAYNPIEAVKPTGDDPYARFTVVKVKVAGGYFKKVED